MISNFIYPWRLRFLAFGYSEILNRCPKAILFWFFSEQIQMEIVTMLI